MAFLDRLFGAEPQQARPSVPTPARSEDEIAIERYRYLLRTAPPETIEQVHAEAFAKLSDGQRAQVFEELSRNAPAGEAPRGQDAASLASAATRSELRQPGTLERSFQGPSFGSMLGSSILGTVVGYVIGSALVSAFMPADLGSDSASDTGGDSGDASADASGDAPVDASAAGDSGFGDSGFGDFGGGGDFGDFGF